MYLSIKPEKFEFPYPLNDQADLVKNYRLISASSDTRAREFLFLVLTFHNSR